MEDTLISLVTGPLGALALSVGIIYWLASRIVPIFEKYLENQNARMHELVKGFEQLLVAQHMHTQTLNDVRKDVLNLKSKLL